MPEYKTFEELFGDDVAVAPEAPPAEPVAEAKEPEAAEEPPDEPEELEEEEPEEEDAPPEPLPEEVAEKPQPVEKAKKEEEPPAPRRHKLTIDGEEREVDDEELKRGYSTGKASQQRFQEAKALHEEATVFYQAFLQSPGDALVDLVARKIGDRTKAREKVRDVFIQWLEPDLEESLITDERERQIHRRTRELDDRQKEIDRRDRDVIQKNTQEQEEAFVKSLRDGIAGGLKKHGLPDRDEIWVRAGQLVDMALKAGTKRENALELVPAIMAEIAGEREEAAKKLAQTLKPEEVARLFPDAIEALRKERIEKVRAERAKKRPSGEMTPQPKREKRSKYKSLDEVFGTR